MAGTEVQGSNVLDGTTTGATGNSITHSFRLTATIGNRLTVVVGVDKSITAFTPVAGWNIRHSSIQTDCCLYVIDKISDGTETTVTVNWTGTARLAAIGLLEYSDLDTFDDGNMVESDGSSVSARLTGAVTNAVADSRAFGFWVADSGSNINAGRAYTNSFTEVNYYEEAAGGAPGLIIAELDIAAIASQECEFSTTGGDQMTGAINVYNNSGGGPVTSTPKAPLGLPFNGPFTGPIS